MIEDIKELASKFTYGLYILTCEDYGCVIDTALQISSAKEDEIYFAISINKGSSTCQKLLEGKKFAINIVSQKMSRDLLVYLGTTHSTTEYKFKGLDTSLTGETLVLSGKESLGYILCEQVQVSSFNTHYLIVGKVLEAHVYNKDIAPMTYSDFQKIQY